jgi:hypothetical protein
MKDDYNFNPFTNKFDLTTSTFWGVLAAAPASPGEGDTYLNSGDNKLYMYYSFSWQELHNLTAATPVSGNPIGLLLTLTYA